ncbi:MAG: hypothetical protein B6241_05920 [Spirochaetaceae bacterium 4572_59]|nr:MAG: hypothetical protein B6241_05920 [Spirochaetaceae bacterium 4572_59]
MNCKFFFSYKIDFKSAFSIVILILNILIVLISQYTFNQRGYFTQLFEYGRVLDIQSETLESDPYVPGCKLGSQIMKIEILSGEEKGSIYEIHNTLSSSHNVEAEKGKKYVFSIREEEGKDKVVWLYNYNRLPVLIGLLAFFILIILLIAGKQGFRSLLALSFTAIMILFVMVPLILRGMDPIALSLFCLSLMTLVSFLLLTGWSRKTLIALLGTIGGILAAGLVSLVASGMAHLSGINLDKGEQILYIARDFGIRIHGFLFISILIASLGAVMDVAMSLASSMEEIKKHNPGISAREHFKSGMIIGRDLIGTMVNTLILAFTGSSFTLILMIAGLSMAFRQFINIPLIAIEIIQALAGSIGIIFSVPLTNILATLLHSKET